MRSQPADANYVTYTYIAMNRVDLVRESGSTTLADYAYDTLGRRGTLTRGDGSVSTFSYDNASRLTGLAHNLTGTANDQTYGFAFTAASQISQRTASNNSYNWTSVDDTVPYQRDGLNRYTSVDGVGFSYDPRQNLTNDGARRFCYDLENHLTGVAPVATDPCATPSTLALAYDPLGRLRQTTAASAATDFLYDGDRLVAEYNGAGAVLRRYVHGPGVDEPLVWYEGAALTDRRYLVPDHQGTIVAASGSTTTLYPYGPYGEPSSWTGSRFRYTGQIALPEAQLYHYKARVYDPMLGRYLQTDPVGYEDDLNLYQYALGDPLRYVDPQGTEVQIIGDDNYYNSTNQMLTAIAQTEEGRAAVEQLVESPNAHIIAQPGANEEIDARMNAAGVIANMTVGLGPGAYYGEGSGSIIYFDQNDTEGGVDDSGSRERPPVVGLGHEIGHALNVDLGQEPQGREVTGAAGTTPPREERPLQIENAVRQSLGLPDRSTFYPPDSESRRER